MNIELPAGRYVVAVSGGVDSVVLLHVLARRPDLKLTVAHFDHGIRDDSETDRQLVATLAGQLKLPFVYHAAKLGAQSSEASARQARYEFLETVRRATQAQAIVTAHHQDDVLETAVHNLLRGTHRHGLGVLHSTPTRQRPMLDYSKQQIREYAAMQGLTWREDTTNSDTRYRRNYIRHKILPRLSDEQRQELLGHITRTKTINEELDARLVNYLHQQPGLLELKRSWLIMLPHDVAMSIMHFWLKLSGVGSLTKRQTERAVIYAKSAKPGTKHSLDKTFYLQLSSNCLALKRFDR